jgi:DNA invertase Pin-like site-specific DNA recombinase
MSGKRIGYIRVSTLDQNPERQLEGIPLDKKFVDFASARSTDRSQLKAMLEYVREGDVVIVHSMDRLARNLLDLRNVVDQLVSQKVQVQFLKESLVFDGSDNAMSKLMLNLMGAFAEFEYAFIRERQREGIEIAKRNGKYTVGVPTKLTKELKEKLTTAMKTRKSKVEICEELGISRTSLYKYLKEI